MFMHIQPHFRGESLRCKASHGACIYLVKMLSLRAMVVTVCDIAGAPVLNEVTW